MSLQSIPIPKDEVAITRRSGVDGVVKDFRIFSRTVGSASSCVHIYYPELMQVWVSIWMSKYIMALIYSLVTNRKRSSHYIFYKR